MLVDLVYLVYLGGAVEGEKSETSGTWGMVCLVCLVYLVYLVCLVGRIGRPTRRTKETRQTEQTGLRIPFASSRFQKSRCRGILLPYSWSVDFCDSSSDCVPEECHESHPGLLWAFSTVDG